MSAIPKVPTAYCGVWQRTLLRTPHIEDSTSRVYWLQTRDWHADIRVPAERPQCAGKNELEALERDELRGLALQQGFAGITLVEGDICRWLRQYDFQPPTGNNDIGRMVFDTPERLLEYGVHAEYFEIWERVPGSAAGPFSVTLCENPDCIYLTAGDFFMTLRPRAAPLPVAENLSGLAAKCDDDDLRALLDFEIAFGWRNDASEWQIALCTHPWQEGRTRRIPGR